MARGYGPGTAGEYGGGPGNQPGEPGSGGGGGAGETARERGIRTAATDPGRTRATTEGRAGRQAVARTRERERARNPFSFIGDFLTDEVDRRVENLGVKSGELSFQGLLGAINDRVNEFTRTIGSPTNPALAAVADMVGRVNERMIDSGHRPGEVAGTSFRGATPAEDDWGGFIAASIAHDAERGQVGERTRPAEETGEAPTGPPPQTPQGEAQSIMDEYDAIAALEGMPTRQARRSPRAQQTKRQAVATAMARAEIRGAARGTMGTY